MDININNNHENLESDDDIFSKSTTIFTTSTTSTTTTASNNNNTSTLTTSPSYDMMNGISSLNTTTSGSGGLDSLKKTSPQLIGFNNNINNDQFIDTFGLNSSSSPNKNINSNNNLRNSRRKQQSKSQSYSNFHLMTELQEEYKSEQLLSVCSMLKEKLKQLTVQIEFDISEFEHKDQEIDLLKSKINRYNTDIREKEEENDLLQEKNKSLGKEIEEQRNENEKLKSDLQSIKNQWVQPTEIDGWKEQMEELTNELEIKDTEIEDWITKSKQKDSQIAELTNQIKKEKEFMAFQRSESDSLMKQFKTDREKYYLEITDLQKKIEKHKSKQIVMGDRIYKLEYDYEQLNRNYEKIKNQLINAEKENLELNHSIESIRGQLELSAKQYKDLSSSQQSMTQELQQKEHENLAIRGLMNKTELDSDEKVSLLMSEYSKSNDTISKLSTQIQDLEQQLRSERLTKQISTVSLANTDKHFSLDERHLMRIIQEKDEENIRYKNQIQRLCIDNETLRDKLKQLEENSKEMSSQLTITRENFTDAKRELNIFKESMLFMSNENFNDSFDNSITAGGDDNNNNNNSNNSNNINNSNGFNKRKSLDVNLFNQLNNLQQNEDILNSNLSPIKTPIKSRSLTLASSTSNSPNSAKIAGSATQRLVDLEDMLEKSRAANIGYQLHIRFLDKEIQALEKESNQQKDLNNSIIKRLNLDLEESKKLNNRIRKTFLLRFAKEEDSIFLDYYTLTDKFKKPFDSSNVFDNNNNNNTLSSVTIIKQHHIQQVN